MDHVVEQRFSARFFKISFSFHTLVVCNRKLLTTISKTSCYQFADWCFVQGVGRMFVVKPIFQLREIIVLRNIIITTTTVNCQLHCC